MTYSAALKRFHEEFGEINSPDELEFAISEFVDILTKEGKTPMTLNTYINAIITYYRDKGVTIPTNKWRRIRRRILPPSRPSTFDSAGSHEEWKKILTHMSLAGRSLFLFLLSTGCRIGEALQLKISDLDLESDPPRAYIRPEYTKGGFGGRVVFMTYEAKDAIVQYIQSKFLLKKRTPENIYNPKLRTYMTPSQSYSNKVWDFGYAVAHKMLDNALRKSGLNKRDPRTGRRLIHIHSTRKFFRSNCGLPDALTHALMGHAQRAGEEYKAIAMPRLTIFERTATDKLDILKLIARSLGVSTEKLDTVLRDAVSFEDATMRIGKLIRDSLRSNKEYAIVEEDYVQTYLLNGWDVAKVLNDGR
ncbi:site-specific integrase [Thermococcus sp. 2319x1]|uniref:tyrosine-type recombinase/integrase n=1 Tax=Thermococcus sp. 2319x1 TaxID=1674923 RepID=UPI0015822445|nr:site-specific integrase [Thermococcus sp. 2319x1]